MVLHCRGGPFLRCHVVFIIDKNYKTKLIVSRFNQAPVVQRADNFIHWIVNLVPRVLRLSGQQVGARRDSGEFEKF